ncbi:major facilitator superfamily domain-containing protein [Dipodascopsis tothii]|uniref:major facilitator superfamily domain-containing protein n=1 Tax=Dipodascopsis tothii TaxID=44089 RepID=UPI0034CEC0E6
MATHEPALGPDNTNSCKSDSVTTEVTQTKDESESRYMFTDKTRPKTASQRLLGSVWDAFGKEPVERRFVLRLDRFLFIYSLLSLIIKTLDQSNISNAYVSGMKEDLALYGQERNLFSTFFNMGYLFGSLPCQIIINRGMRPSVWLPACELIWSGLVMSIALCKNARPIYAIRFFIGLFESSVFPGFVLILGSWYTPDELGKRIALFELSGQAASMFSGYLQAGLYSSMNGRHGIAGWKWLFIVDGIISIPIALAGFYCIPDFPTNTCARWLNADQREYAIQRMLAVGRKPPTKLTMSEMIKIFKSPRPWLFLLPYNISFFGYYTGYFNLWLKAVGHYTVEQINLVPTAGNAIGVIMAYVVGTLSDQTGNRWVWMLLSLVPATVGAIILSVWYVPEGAVMFANLFAFASSPLQPLTITWAAECFQDSAATRGLIVGFGNTVSFAMSAWTGLVFFPTPDAPHYKFGYQAAVGFQILAAISILVFLKYVKWEEKKFRMVKNEFGLMVRLEDLVLARPETTKSTEDEENCIR